MLDEKGIDYQYREYRRDPLSRAEIERVLVRLGLKARDVLRVRDRAFKDLGLTGNESDRTLIGHMAEHPTLLERPIAVRGETAVVGRPVERILDLV